MAKFCSLFSGSKGNSTYIESGGKAIIIDAGVSCKRLMEALNDRNLDIKNVEALFITHEHTDHVSGIRVFASKNNIPVYATNGTTTRMRQNGNVNEKIKSIVFDTPEVLLSTMKITNFKTKHDCAESCGYVIETEDGKKISVATDLGVMTDDIVTSVSGSDLVMVESNYDVNMLMNGKYPYMLKRRILSENGHLSNDDCADTIVRWLADGTSRFVLAHLSQENNYPDLAKQTSVAALQMAGAKEKIDYEIKVARQVSEENFIIV